MSGSCIRLVCERTYGFEAISEDDPRENIRRTSANGLWVFLIGIGRLETVGQGAMVGRA